MIKKEEFLKKYPTLESFQKKHPIGEKFRYYDRCIWEIRGYMNDEFPNGEKLTLVALRTYTRYKDDDGCYVKNWSYKMQELYDFYCVYDFSKREHGKDFKKFIKDEDGA